jgi:hypothetical protein
MSGCGAPIVRGLGLRGVAFWVFLLILALLGMAFAERPLGGAC